MSLDFSLSVGQLLTINVLLLSQMPSKRLGLNLSRLSEGPPLLYIRRRTSHLFSIETLPGPIFTGSVFFVYRIFVASPLVSVPRFRQVTWTWVTVKREEDSDVIYKVELRGVVLTKVKRKDVVGRN